MRGIPCAGSGGVLIVALLWPAPTPAQVASPATATVTPLAPAAPVMRVPAGEGGAPIPLLGEAELAARARVAAALDTKVHLDVDEAPLAAVLAELEKQAGVEIEIDVTTLEDDGGDLAAAETRHVSDITLRSALRLILEPRDLSFMTHNEVLLVTSPARVETQFEVVVYPVADLLEVDAAGRLSYDQLIEAIATVVAPTTWDDVRGPDNIKGIRGSLLVLQTAENHRLIEQLITALRKLPPAARDKVLTGQPVFGHFGPCGWGAGELQ